MKRVLSAVIAVIMVLSLMAGCASKDTPKDVTKDAGTTQETATQKEGYRYTGELPLTDENVKLTILTHTGHDPSLAIASPDLPVYQKISELTNVTIEWQTVPRDNYKEVVNTRLLAGQDLPDIINMHDLNLSQMASDGLIIPMDDLMEENAPYFKEFLKEKGNEHYKSIWSNADDGKLYCIRCTVLPSTLQYNLLVNHMWREKLNIEEPKTTDDFYTMLKAFKENDMNENGKPDEIPFVCARNGIYLLGNAFGLQLIWANGFQLDDSGKVTYDYMSPRYKELLEYLNKLYVEDLLDKEYSKNTAQMMFDKTSSNVAGVISYYATFTDKFSGLSPLTEDNSGATKVFSVMAEPLKGPHGDQYMLNRVILGGDPMTITKASKNKEVAMRLIDWLFASPEARMLKDYGIEGVTYKKEGDKIVKIDSPKYNTWGEFWHSVGAGQPPYAHQQSKESWYDGAPQYIIDLDMGLQKYFIQPDITPTAYTKEESDKRTAIMKDIDTYRIEMMDKFITGQVSLDKFDEYVNAMKEMGIEDVLAIEQAKYDRSK